MFYKRLTIDIVDRELPTRANIRTEILEGDRVARKKHVITLYGRKVVLVYPATWTDEEAISDALKQIIIKTTEDIQDILELKRLYEDLIQTPQYKKPGRRKPKKIASSGMRTATKRKVKGDNNEGI